MAEELRTKIDWGSLAPLRLRARVVAEGVYAGAHRSARRGAGVEFGGHRPYVPGDDLRWLDRASIDWTTIEESIKKTNNVLLVEQGVRGTSYGGWLADEIQRRYFDWLDQPVQRVTGAEASPSISKVLERAAAARTEEVVDGLKLVMQAKGDA
jgi:hypothetical protein